MEHNETLFIATIIILVAFASFGLGRLSKIERQKEPVRIENPKAIMQAAAIVPDIGNPATDHPAGTSEEIFVASKNGTKYHFPWCSGAQAIKDSNKIVFKSREEAQRAGYTPAANCKGL